MESKQGSALEKMQIAEVENSNDNENSDSEEEEKRLYTYNCPVFRVSGIGANNLNFSNHTFPLDDSAPPNRGDQ